MYKLLNKKLKGEITIFLALMLMIIIGLITNLILVSAIKSSKNISKIIADLSIESVFSEYDKNLLDDYDLFAIDGGYGQSYKEDNINSRFEFYNNQNLKIENNRLSVGKFYGMSFEGVSLKGLELIGDNNYNNIRAQIIKYERNKLGDGWAGILMGDSWFINNIVDLENKYESDSKDNKKTKDENEDIEKVMGEDNPINFSESEKNKDVLNLILGDSFKISNKEVTDYTFYSQRNNNHGFGTTRGIESNKSLSHIAICEFLISHLSYASSKRENSYYDYELEYIIGKNNSDRENLKSVLSRLLVIRQAVNYAYLISSPTRQAEVSSLAITLTAPAPYLEPVVKQGLLLSFAFIESVLDVRALVNGKKVALVKSDINWKTKISNISEIKNILENGNYSDDKDGILYKDYLRILLLLSDDTHMLDKFMDLVEINFNMKEEGKNFRADSLIVAANADCNYIFDRNVRYKHNISYYYK